MLPFTINYDVNGKAGSESSADMINVWKSKRHRRRSDNSFTKVQSVGKV